MLTLCRLFVPLALSLPPWHTKMHLSTPSVPFSFEVPSLPQRWPHCPSPPAFARPSDHLICQPNLSRLLQLRWGGPQIPALSRSSSGSRFCSRPDHTCHLRGTPGPGIWTAGLSFIPHLGPLIPSQLLVPAACHWGMAGTQSCSCKGGLFKQSQRKSCSGGVSRSNFICDSYFFFSMTSLLTEVNEWM